MCALGGERENKKISYTVLPLTSVQTYVTQSTQETLCVGVQTLDSNSGH